MQSAWRYKATRWEYLKSRLYLCSSERSHKTYISLVCPSATNTLRPAQMGAVNRLLVQHNVYRYATASYSPEFLSASSCQTVLRNVHRTATADAEYDPRSRLFYASVVIRAFICTSAEVTERPQFTQAVSRDGTPEVIPVLTGTISKHFILLYCL